MQFSKLVATVILLGFSVAIPVPNAEPHSDDIARRGSASKWSTHATSHASRFTHFTDIAVFDWPCRYKVNADAVTNAKAVNAVPVTNAKAVNAAVVAKRAGVTNGLP